MKRRSFVWACGTAACACMLSRAARAGDKENKMPLAACGLDCNTCDTRKKGCEGCHGPDEKVWSGQCKIRLCCIKQKKLSNCSECDGFPCEHVTAFENDPWAHHKKAIAHLRELRKNRVSEKKPAEEKR